MQEELLRAAFRGQSHRREQLFLMAVNAAGGQEAHNMDRFIFRHGAIDGVQIRAVSGKCAAGNRLINAGDGLVNDAPGAEAHMAHFGVTHLAFREPDIQPGS